MYFACSKLCFPSHCHPPENSNKRIYMNLKEQMKDDKFFQSIQNLNVLKMDWTLNRKSYWFTGLTGGRTMVEQIT